MDNKLGDLIGHDILIEGSLIRAIGPALSVDDADEFDASGMIVIPGLIDTHRHVWQTAIRGVMADCGMLDYFFGIRVRAAAFYSPADIYISQFAGAVEAIDCGVTTLVDYSHNILSPDHAYEAVRGLKESGLRALWCMGFNYPPGTDCQFGGLEGRLRFGHQLAAREFSSRDQLVRFGVAPEETSLASEEDCRDQYLFARETDAVVTQHLNGGMKDGEFPLDVKNFLHRNELLTDKLILVHMKFTTDEEWKMLLDCGASVSFTPETELQMGMGIPPIHQVHSLGLRPTLGADIVSNNSGDMFFPMRLALQMSRGMVNEDVLLTARSFPLSVPLTCREALEWCTINAARAVGMESLLGSISVGKLADIVCLRPDGITNLVCDEKYLPANVVLYANIRDVDSVLISGQFRKRNGRLTADMKDLGEKVRSVGRRICQDVEAAGGFRGDASSVLPSPAVKT